MTAGMPFVLVSAPFREWVAACGPLSDIGSLLLSVFRARIESLPEPDKRYMSLLAGISESMRRRLMAGLQRMQLEPTEQQVELLLGYLSLLIKWNKAYNLTSIRDPEKMVDLHLLDSLAVVSFFAEGENIIDVGTGPGLPGMILAIMYPNKRLTLLDSNGKKTRFMFQAKTELGLTNVTIVNDRVEAYHPPEPFDMIASRAFASLQDMVSWCQHLRADNGRFLAMKGQFPQQELDALPAGYELEASYPIEVPGVEGQRHMLRLKAVDQH